MAEPTDDELLAVAKEHGTVPTYWTTRLHLVDMLRRAIDMPTLDDAEQLLIGDSGDPMPSKFARALRSRFPQPITDEVLRAEGFEPFRDHPAIYQLTLPRRFVFAERRDDGVLVDWGPNTTNNNELIRTPDRLHDVVEHLKGLYGEGEA